MTGLAVVVPTRNRADLVELTLESVLDQSPGVPLTVVVSDNSTSEEQAHLTRQAVERLRDEAADETVLHLIRPGEDLPMGKHWEWARRQAQALTDASHLMYVTDRTLLKRGALATLAVLAAAHPDQVISYNNDEVNDDVSPVTLSAQRGSREVHSVPARRLLHLSSELIVVRPLPRALNSVMPVSALARIEAQHGDVFDSLAPDFCFCFRLLDDTAQLLYVDQSLTVMHGLARSNGRSTTRGVASADTADFIKHSTRGIAPWAPLPSVETTYNVIASEYMRNPGRTPALDRGAYYWSLAAETDGFAPGPMREANVRALEEAGQRFGRLAALRRQLQRVVHFLRVLGPLDFFLLARDRRSQPAARPFTSKEEALDWARAHDADIGATTALRYLRGARVTTTSRVSA
jgi:glycosyltransferase involved in cell wall biosynthesis